MKNAELGELSIFRILMGDCSDFMGVKFTFAFFSQPTLHGQSQLTTLKKSFTFLKTFKGHRHIATCAAWWAGHFALSTNLHMDITTHVYTPTYTLRMHTPWLLHSFYLVAQHSSYRSAASRLRGSCVSKCTRRLQVHPVVCKFTRRFPASREHIMDASYGKAQLSTVFAQYLLKLM